LEYFSLKSKKFFNEKLSKLNEIYEQHELVEKIYKFKLNALMIFNSVFKLNQDTFNNSNYSSLLNNYSRNLESELNKIQENKLEENIEKCGDLCKNSISKFYEVIKKRSDEGYYNIKTTEDLLRDYEK